MNIKKTKFYIYFFIIFLFLLGSCKNITDCKPIQELNFNEDSAFLYIKKQTDLGPRVPNSPAHDSCILYLEKKLKSFGANVILQKTKLERYDEKILNSTNIIAEFYPSKQRRILLFSHYDSRFFADMEKNPLKQDNPIPGANDGASGVGVLLEIGRQIMQKEPFIGVDIIFFDAEDQGQPLYFEVYNEKSWCLGSQYWAKNPHKKNYKALFGIELDMVGSPDASFYKEDNSRYFNNFLVKRFWRLADSLGYKKTFPDKFSKGVLHDHVFVSQIAGIRSILIIDNKPHKKIPYFEHWHTQKDDIENIDKTSLKKVGQTLLNFIYCIE